MVRPSLVLVPRLDVSPKTQTTPADDAGGSSKKKAKKVYLSQADVPRYGLDEALRVANVISDEYGKQPASPLDIAIALDVKPGTGHFRYLCGAALAYGVTDGGPRSPKIGLTELGRRIVAPTVDGDDLQARREALLQPRVVGEFLRRYDGSKLPTEKIGRNVLETMGVPDDSTARTFELIVESARALGLVKQVKGDSYVQLDAAVVAAVSTEPDPIKAEEVDERSAVEGLAVTPDPEPPTTLVQSDLKSNRRVFITHGKNKKIVEQLKELLTFGDFEPVISMERESVAKPVPDKVLDDMRSCGAAVIHVGVEQKLLDQSGDEVSVLNPNVLIEIGAAMMRYERRFILLVEDGTTLPSNLQGLYEVRYSGDELDYPATMKLLKAFNEFKA